MKTFLPFIVFLFYLQIQTFFLLSLPLPMPSLKESLQTTKSQLLLASQHIDALTSLLPQTNDATLSSSSLPQTISADSLSLSRDKAKEWREKLEEALKVMKIATDTLSSLSDVKISTQTVYVPREYTPEEVSKIVMIQSLVRSWRSRRMKRKIQIERELLETESKYVKDLGVLFSHFLSPLQSLSLLSKDQEESIFGLPTLFDIHSSHSFFLSLLQKSFENGICLGLSTHWIYILLFIHSIS